MPILSDGAAVSVRDVEVSASQALVKTGKPATGARKGARVGLAMLALGLAAGAPSARRALGRVTAGALGAAALWLLAMRSSKRLSQWAISKILPTVMNGMDIALRKVKGSLLVPLLQGDVLDFGAGDGSYLQYVHKAGDRVRSVVSLEPNVNLHANIAKRARELGVQTRIEGCFADELADRGARFDTIIVGNVLCEVPDQRSVLGDLYRLLRPGGVLVFFEHVAHDRGWTRVLQEAINPFWRIFSDGCNCNRETLREIERVPWRVHAWEVHTDSVPLDRLHVGVAVRPADETAEPSRL